MTEVTVPPLVPATSEGGLADYPAHWATHDPGRVTFSVVDGSGGWNPLTAGAFWDEVVALGRGFIAAGVEAGDRVLIMSRTRYEWTLCDFALWAVGAVPVPVYETSSTSQLRWIARDAEAVAVIVENAELAAMVSRVRGDLPGLRDVWQIEGGSLTEVAEAGAEVDPAEVEARRSAVRRSDLATIIYTSGTTGDPKGCELTHGNFMGVAENITEHLEVIFEGPDRAMLLFLPLAHVFARCIQVVFVHEGARLGHTPDPRTLMDDLAGFRPTFLLAVPRVFEKVYNATQQKAEAGGKGGVFRWAARTADRYSRSLDAGRTSPALKVQHAIADRLVFRRLREALGGRVTHAISGGAALGERLGHFFRGAGLLVLEGYGLTETTAPATVNTPEDIRIGTVGRPIAGAGIRIAEDGEIQVSGVGVFPGYHHAPEATAEALVDGWFRTGDIGELDADGFLRITGRTKELLVTAGGKNVSPGPMEDRLRSHPLISQCMVIGDGRPYVAALITLDEEMLPGWAENNGLAGITLEQARTDATVLVTLQSVVDEVNETVSRAESIRSFAVLEEDFTTDNGMLTPSMKLRRGRADDVLREQIEELYSRPRPDAS